MMKSSKRIINMIVFSQILVLLGVLIWLWIRRFSKDGIVGTPRMEIDLLPHEPPSSVPAEPDAQEPVKAGAELPLKKPVKAQSRAITETPLEQPAEQPEQEPRTAKPTPTRRQAVKTDDLKRIEGIGPKIAAALQAAGINTYKQLSRARVERLKGILSEAGIIADASTWPEQAALAAAGDWLGLAELKASLKGGRRTD